MNKLTKNEKKYLADLGERIKNARKEKGITQVELAKMIDTQHPQIGRLERGETNVSIILLKRISESLDISSSELIS